MPEQPAEVSSMNICRHSPAATVSVLEVSEQLVEVPDILQVKAVAEYEEAAHVVDFLTVNTHVPPDAEYFA